jgi:hypothetical protein
MSEEWSEQVWMPANHAALERAAAIVISSVICLPLRARPIFESATSLHAIRPGIASRTPYPQVRPRQ